MVVSRIPQVPSILQLCLRVELVPGHPVQGTRQTLPAKVVWSIQGSYTASPARTLQPYPVEEYRVRLIVLSILRLYLRVESVPGHPPQATQQALSFKVVWSIQGSCTALVAIWLMASGPLMVSRTLSILRLYLRVESVPGHLAQAIH